MRESRAPAERIAGEKFNAGSQNLSVAETAQAVREVVEQELPARAPIEIVTTASDDPRSYHICAEKVGRQLGFAPRRTIDDAVRDLIRAFDDGRIPDALADDRYYNVKMMMARQSPSESDK